MPDEINEGTRAIIQWGLAFVVVAIVGSLLFASSGGTFNRLENQAIRHNIGYVDSRNNYMRDMITQYHKDEQELATTVKGNSQGEAATQAHMKSLVKDIRGKANELSDDEVARDVAEFLAEHKSE
jgi:hypothetical protein